MKKSFNTTIDEFLASRKIALAGVSRNPKKFGGAALKELREKGFEVYPIHPVAEEIDGVKCFHSVTEIPADVKHLVSMVPKTQVLDTVTKALDHGITNIWIQQGSDTPEAIRIAKERNAGLVVKTCILMHSTPVKSIHKFHRGMMKLFGALPK